jgi:hypothetical protein
MQNEPLTVDHSIAAEDDENKRVTVSGTVTSGLSVRYL